MMNRDSVQGKEAKSFQIKQHMFRSLTPQQGIDIKGYREALDYAFSNDDIRNIAISGSYGSGESSVLNTYVESGDDEGKGKFIRISLARFEEQGKESKMAETHKDSLPKTLQSQASTGAEVIPRHQCSCFGLYPAFSIYYSQNCKISANIKKIACISILSSV